MAEEANTTLSYQSKVLNCLHYGLSAGQKRHRGDSPRKKEKTKITQRSLEENCCGTAGQRLGEPQS